MIDIFVDGVLYQNQRIGGVSRIYNEILPRICDLEPSLKFNILTTGRLQQTIPAHEHILHRSFFPIDDLLRPRRIWWSIRPKSRMRIQ